MTGLTVSDMQNISSGGYIAEIDGLRALAVSLVLGFHFFPSGMPGGFIGVDVFFVISGFVIFRAFFQKLVSGDTSLVSFYIRRIRRLAPAYLIVLLVVTVGSSLVLEPRILRNYGESLIAQPLYLQNFVFWAQGEYFDTALSKPLLHTWSLAVEEQFYLLVGALVVLCRLNGRVLIPLLLSAGLASLVLGFWVYEKSPKTAFYMTPTRIWEFGLGVGVYLLVSKRPFNASRMIRGLLVAGSTCALFATAFLFDEHASFPGAQSLIACIATAVLLLVFSVDSDRRHVLFGSELATYLGQRSYSLYLWHWPVIVFAYSLAGELALPTSVMLLLVSVVLADLTYRMIESPTRHAKLFRDDRDLICCYTLSSIVIVYVGGLFILSGGWVQRYPEPIRTYHEVSQWKTEYRCTRWFRLLHPAAEICSRNSQNGAGGVLLLGDSHADRLDDTVAQIGSEEGVPVWMTARSCDIHEFGRVESCGQGVFERIVSKARDVGIETVFIVSFWRQASFDEKAFRKNAKVLLDAGFDIVISEVVPNGGFFDPLRRTQGMAMSALENPDEYQRSEHEQRAADIHAVFESFQLQHSGRVRVFSPADAICDPKICPFESGGVPLYTDTNHLSPVGIGLISSMMREQLFGRN